MRFNCCSPKKVYDKSNKKHCYTSEDFELILSESSISIPHKDGGKPASLTSLIPQAIDLGFKITANILKKWQQKFTGEYSISNSYLEAGNRTVPNITFQRKICLKSKFKTALEVVLKAQQIMNIDAYFYYIESIDLSYSKAMTTKKSKMFDYTFEIKPTFLIGNKKQTIELHPISLSSIPFGKKELELNKYRTDIIPLPKNAFFTEVSIKIVETNPYKVKADKILEIFNTYKDDAKTIINNFIQTNPPSTNEKAKGLTEEKKKTK